MPFLLLWRVLPLPALVLHPKPLPLQVPLEYLYRHPESATLLSVTGL